MKAKKVKLKETTLKECIRQIKKDPSGEKLTKGLRIMREHGIISKDQENFYFFEAERIVYGVNISYYNVH